MSTLRDIVSRSHYLLMTASRCMEFMNKGSRKVNVCMFHAGRCGSTVLSSMLNQTDNIHWSGEIFTNKKAKYRDFRFTKGHVVEEILKLRMFRHRCEVYGMELKRLPSSPINAIDMQISEFTRLLMKNDFSHFILLQRKNYLRIITSAVAGRQRGMRWHVRKPLERPERVVIDLDNLTIAGKSQSLIEHLDCLDRYYGLLQKLLEDTNTLEITYEEDVLADPRVAYGKICEFIGVELGDSDIKLQQTNPFPLSELIVNYDEVAKLLETTSYRWMLDD